MTDERRMTLGRQGGQGGGRTAISGCRYGEPAEAAVSLAMYAPASSIRSSTEGRFGELQQELDTTDHGGDWAAVAQRKAHIDGSLRYT